MYVTNSKRIVILFTILAGFLLVSNPLFASVYYVDFLSGNDGNTGDSTASPFKHSPGDANAEQNALSTILLPGDTVIFKGGIEYRGTITLTWSGSSIGGDIVYDGNSAGTWGMGKAILNGGNAISAIGFSAPRARSYIIINNFDISEFGGYPVGSEPTGDCTSPITSAAWGAAISFYDGGSYITIKNSYLHELGNWLNQPPFAAGSIDGYGINLRGVSNVVIDNVTIEKTMIGIGLRSSSSKTVDSITIKNSDISYVVWGIDIAVVSTHATFSNIDIRDNAIHDYEEYDLANWLGCGGSPHTDGIFVRSDYDYSTFTNINIHRNDFYSTYANGGGTAAVNLTSGGAANVFNNTFRYTNKGRTISLLGAVYPNGATSVIKIYNNSFLVPETAIGISNGTAKKLVYIKNNVFYDPRTSGTGVAVHAEDTTSDPVELDYNQYFTLNPAGYVFRSGNFGWNTFSNLQDLGFEINGAYGDPKYINASKGGGALANLNDLRLQSNSPAINAGNNISTMFTVDKNKVLRSQGLWWDKGAFETAGETIKPMPPTAIVIN